MKFAKSLARKLSSIKERDLRFEIALVHLARWIYPKYRFTWPYLDWWSNQWFNTYLERFNELTGLNTHRRWQMYQLIHLTESVPGDTAECGAYQGAGSFLICEMNRLHTRHSRQHHIFDSFEGISEPETKDGKHWHQGDLAAQESLLHKNLADFTRYRVYKGWIPDRFHEVSKNNFSFVHIDVDLYAPTKRSIEFFYPRLNTGGILLCDDYGCTTCPGATEAIDQFLIDKPERFISLAAGGGFLIKA